MLATIAVFVALGGMTSSITGLLYDRPLLVHIGATAMVIGVISFVWLLRPGGGTGE